MWEILWLRKSPQPAFGLGTFRLQGQVVIDSVSTALALGHRLTSPKGIAPHWV